MRRLLKFLTASPLEKMLFLVAMVVVTLVRLGLTFTSYNFLKRLVPQANPSRSAPPERLRSVAIAVSRAARLVPAATCLTQALSAQILLAGFGYPSRIRVGVARNPEGAIIAHAWLLADERVVLGGGAQSLATYNILTDLNSG